MLISMKWTELDQCRSHNSKKKDNTNSHDFCEFNKTIPCFFMFADIHNYILIFIVNIQYHNQETGPVIKKRIGLFS